MTGRPPHISASILNADFATLGDEVRRAVDGGVDSIHLDVMDGHFVDNISMGAVVVRALRPYSRLPFHSHLMISRPLAFVDEFVEVGSDVVVAHVEADDRPADVVAAIRAAGCGAGLAINPETSADAVIPFLRDLQLVLVMTVNPGFGGQEFIAEALPKAERLRDVIRELHLDLPIGIDGGVNEASIGRAHAAGGEVLVCGSALYRHGGDLAPVVTGLRQAALDEAASAA
ncbi:MAG: ribulose-phosphate 3-epimerase [Candidatus Limnocylindria bacterium]